MLTHKIASYLQRPYPIAPLITFRVLFGLAMLISTLRFVLLDWVAVHYINTKFTFKYYGFEWVTLLPAWAMYGLHGLMLAGALGLCLGAFYRLSAVIFFLSFTYCQLIDLTYYLNHYYFVSLVSLLLCFVPAHAAFSVDSWAKPTLRQTQVAFWAVAVFRWQLAIVYIFAGIAKINATWLLEALPLRIWLPAADKMPLLGWFFKQVWVAYLFAWAGMCYDICIVFFLSLRKTRWLAYACVIFFHVMVGLLFQIGVFPLVMILATPVFFNADWHIKIWQTVSKYLPLKSLQTEKNAAHHTFYAKKSFANGFLLVFVCIFFSFQILFPFRYLFYKGNLFWTEQGYRFSWRVMLMEKAGTATFYVKDTKTNREGVVVNSEFLNLHQEKQMAMQPDMILQFAKFLKTYYQKQGVHHPQVRAEVYVTLNGKPSKLLINPNKDLTTLADSWLNKDWILEE
jgi:hypothetical protein